MAGLDSNFKVLGRIPPSPERRQACRLQDSRGKQFSIDRQGYLYWVDAALGTLNWALLPRSLRGRSARCLGQFQFCHPPRRPLAPSSPSRKGSRFSNSSAWPIPRSTLAVKNMLFMPFFGAFFGPKTLFRPRHMAAARFASGTGWLLSPQNKLRERSLSQAQAGPTCCLDHAGPLQAARSFQLLHGISAQPGGDGHTSPAVVLLVQKSILF